jgi:hypothetical protein
MKDNEIFRARSMHGGQDECIRGFSGEAKKKKKKKGTTGKTWTYVGILLKWISEK